jgi:hypothetical protein
MQHGRSWLVILWNVVLTIALGVVWARSRAALPDELAVARIDVVDANGTRRMSMTNRDRLPDLVIEGKHAPRAARAVQPAGIVLSDEQGNEAGGYVTTKTASGENQSMLLLDYGRSEAIGIMQRHDAAHYQAALLLNDPPRPGEPNDGSGTRRIYVSTADRVAAVELKDTHGRARIRLEVDASDRPSIAILDEAGAVVSRLPSP